MKRAAIGLRAKTGKAIAVVLTMDSDTPSFVWRGVLSLVDPRIQATAEPYHEVMELPWNEATVAVQPLAAAIEAVASAAIRDVIASTNVPIRVAGIVGSPPRNLARIGNEHIRAHAAEGVLFRQVLEAGAKANHLSCVAFSEFELKENESSLPHLAATLQEFGRIAGAPWRADEKLAATAAWLALSR